MTYFSESLDEWVGAIGTEASRCMVHLEFELWINVVRVAFRGAGDILEMRIPTRSVEPH